MQTTIETIVNTFFNGIGITIDSLLIEVLEKDVNITLKTPDSSVIIGMHGANIEVFQHLLGRMIEKQAGTYIHTHLEVNDYMKSKDERLFRFLDSKIAFVTSTGKSSRVPNLTSYERKKAHSYIAEKGITGLSTHSDGEGAERFLVIEFTGPITQSSTPTQVPTHKSSVELAEDGVGI